MSCLLALILFSPWSDKWCKCIFCDARKTPGYPVSEPAGSRAQSHWRNGGRDRFSGRPTYSLLLRQARLVSWNWRQNNCHKPSALCLQWDVLNIATLHRASVPSLLLTGRLVDGYIQNKQRPRKRNSPKHIRSQDLKQRKERRVVNCSSILPISLVQLKQGGLPPLLVPQGVIYGGRRCDVGFVSRFEAVEGMDI